MTALPALAPQADLALVRRIERATALAVPAEQEWEVGGWTCRWGADGRVGRVSTASVSPFSEPFGPLAGLEEVAASYAARGLPARVRLTPLCPPETHALAAERPARAPANVMVRDLTGFAPHAPGVVEVDLAEDASPEWREAFTTAHGPTEGPPRLAVAEASPTPRRFASARLGGDLAGMALGVVTEGALGVFDVMTVPEHRRRGAATAAVSALLAWGREAGADVAYLQVAAGNAPAAALYERLGFRTLYSYAYAELPASSSPR